MIAGKGYCPLAGAILQILLQCKMRHDVPGAFYWAANAKTRRRSAAFELRL
jgi:hypothetical protein